MTSNNTVDLGMPLSLMGLEKPFTTMVMCIRDNLSKDKGVGLEPIGLTRFINILVTGNIIAFGEKVNSIKMMMSFFKDSLRKGWNMAKVNINMKMVTISKEITLKTKKGERENIILVKVEYCNLNLTLILLKYRKFI